MALNVYACLVSILIFQLVESIILLPEMSTINEMVLVTDVDPDKVTDKYYKLAGLKRKLSKTLFMGSLLAFTLNLVNLSSFQVFFCSNLFIYSAGAEIIVFSKHTCTVEPLYDGHLSVTSILFRLGG